MIAGKFRSTPSIELTPEEALQQRCKRMNHAVGDLEDFNCKVCLNKGFVYEIVNGEITSRLCECRKTRRSIRYLRDSGMEYLVRAKTFRTWKTEGESWRESLLSAAKSYCDNPSGWFYVSGPPGTGKTHICTAICGDMLRRGEEVRYMIWRNSAVDALANARERYSEIIDPSKYVPILYIDDLFKKHTGVTPAEVDLTWEIVNTRYIDVKKYTIFSSELPISAIMDISPSLGSRIAEKARGNVFDLSGKENWRMII